jgi:fermentation-respiration switch protein FrsA (DUF1100 family)
MWTLRLLLAALVIGALIVRCDSWFYYPSQRIWETPPQFGMRHEEVRFSTTDGVSLHGWWLPAETGHLGPGRADATRARGTVIHFHGNAENITAHLVLVEWLPRAGYNVLMFDYRGYGRSGGRVTRAGTIRDGHAAVDYVLTRPELDPRRIFAYGQSLGGAIAVVVAAERPEIRAVVVESTFSGYRRIAAAHLRKLVLVPAAARGLSAVLVSAGYDPIDAVGRISPRPLLVIAAEQDQICDPRLGRELYEAAGEPKEFWLVPGAGHLAILESAGEELERRVLEFLERAGR